MLKRFVGFKFGRWCLGAILTIFPLVRSNACLFRFWTDSQVVVGVYDMCVNVCVHGHYCQST